VKVLGEWREVEKHGEPGNTYVIGKGGNCFLGYMRVIPGNLILCDAPGKDVMFMIVL
jgi:hypothetical protein